MSFTVSLHIDDKMNARTKYRGGFKAPAVWTDTAVNIGNFSSLNLFADNSVELACGQLQPPKGTYERATDCNYISIKWGKWTVIGVITDWEYINDGNVRISYGVDAFSSAQASGTITLMRGLCERADVIPSAFDVNLQPEPFSPSDVTVANPTLTASFNSAVQAIEGISPTNAGVHYAGTRYILTVSPAVVEYCSLSVMQLNPTVPSPTLKNTGTSFRFYANDTNVNCGGVFKGTPICFDDIYQVQKFIKDILSGCGFRAVLPPSGANGQSMDSYNQYLTESNTGGGQTSYQYKNTEPLESVRFITLQDIYNLYCVPNNFAVNSTTYIQSDATITGFKSTANLHKFGAEGARQNKLMAHPYYYARIVTANGDTQTIIPQCDYSPTAETPTVRVSFRYIGGDTPRLMCRVVPTKNGSTSAYASSSVCEWFTVRSYPAVTLSINDSFNPQVQRDVANARKLTATYANACANSRLSNPIKQGYADSYMGHTNTSEGQSWWGSVMGSMGLGGSIDASNGTKPLFKDKNLQEQANMAREMSAGNFITAETSSIMGNDFISQFGVPAGACYDCGATDAEMFSYSRYLEDYGASLNCIINPLTNAGNIWNGNGTITPFNGKTFYQFLNIHVEGNMPVGWKDNIRNLFEGGVHLIDN